MSVSRFITSLQTKPGVLPSLTKTLFKGQTGASEDCMFSSYVLYGAKCCHLYHRNQLVTEVIMF